MPRHFSLQINPNSQNEGLFQIPLDESPHSFIIRHLLIYYPTIKPIGVISKSGHFYCNPYVQREAQHIFHKYSDHFLLEQLSVSESISGNLNSLFDAPDGLYSSIYSAFFDDKNINKSDRKVISYCIDCIREGIEEHGYGYFRHFWDASNYCLIHEKPLLAIDSKNFSESFDSIKKLFAGHELTESSIIGERLILEKTFENEVKWIDSEKYFFLIKAASCLPLIFAYWVKENSHKILDEKTKHFVCDFTDAFLHHFLNPLSKKNRKLFEIMNRRNVAALHAVLLREEVNFLDEFYAEFVDFYQLEMGPRQQGVMREIFSKNKLESCDYCDDMSCIMKRYDQDNAKLVNYSDLTFEYVLNNSHTLKRLIAQGDEYILFSKKPWGVVDVLPYFNPKKMNIKIFV